MTRQVEGYITTDGTFFEDRIEAEVHEATLVLSGLMLGEGLNDHSLKFLLKFIGDYHGEVEAYIKAIRIQQAVETERAGDLPEDEGDTADDEGGSQDAESVQQQPAVSGGHLPDLGRSVSPEEIQNRRKKHGSRSRNSHARRVRGRKDLAAGTQTES